MNNDKYPVAIGKTSMVYEFVSEGEKGRISKLVIYTETHLHNFFNLGFGDKNEETGEIDDRSVTNNGDKEKVLTTVASTLYMFTDVYQDALIFAVGSNKARTRLYRMGITMNLSAIEADFEIFGFCHEQWLPFKKGVNFEAFLAKRKKK